MAMDATGLSVLLGVGIGLVLSWTGAGGGVLATPLLVFALGLSAQQAGPIGLTAVGVASAVGAVLGLREGIVRYRAAALIGGLGMLVAPVGVAVAQLLPSRPLLAAFALVLVWVARRMLWPLDPGDAEGREATPCQVNQLHGRLTWTSSCARALALTGVASGFLSGLLGVGGGFVIVPALLKHSDLDIRSVQATSLAVIALVAASSLGAAAWHGGLNGSIAGPFTLGATVALLAGRLVAARMPALHLQRAFAVTCLAVAALLLARAAGWL